jgi:hypothetical protein
MADSAVRPLSDCFPLFDFRQPVTADGFLKSVRGVDVSNGCRTDFSLVFSPYNRTRNCIPHLPEVCNYGFFFQSLVLIVEPIEEPIVSGGVIGGTLREYSSVQKCAE